MPVKSVSKQVKQKVFVPCTYHLASVSDAKQTQLHAVAAATALAQLSVNAIMIDATLESCPIDPPPLLLVLLCKGLRCRIWGPRRPPESELNHPWGPGGSGWIENRFEEKDFLFDYFLTICFPLFLQVTPQGLPLSCESERRNSERRRDSLAAWSLCQSLFKD